MVQAAGYGPKVLIGAFGSCLLPVRDFAHKIGQGQTGFDEGAGLTAAALADETYK